MAGQTCIGVRVCDTKLMSSIDNNTDGSPNELFIHVLAPSKPNLNTVCDIAFLAQRLSIHNAAPHYYKMVLTCYSAVP
jgi:hypothetical protein